jgi:hypothetical protein
MTPERRSEIAREAAAGRWSKKVAKETHVGVLQIGTREIPCSVLSDGTRVLSIRGISKVLGYGGTAGITADSGAAQLPPFLQSAAIKPFVSSELTALLGAPTVYRPKRGGRTAFGYEATMLPDICSAILDARQNRTLKSNQAGLAEAAEALLRAFAKVGIVALVDEATGYQADRARDELQRLLEAYIAEEMRPWVKLFPDDFFRQTFRLHGWPYQPGNMQGPRYVGKWINKYVYGMLPKEVQDELRGRNPPINGQRRYKHHQFLTDDIGHPVLDRHVNTVTKLMRASKNKEMFIEIFNAAFDVPGTQMSLLKRGADSDPDEDDDE